MREPSIVGHSIHMESVWDYPRPPCVEPTRRRIQVVLKGVTVADSTRALRVLEKTHPPTYYVPLDDVASGCLAKAGGRTTFCEWKGKASYYDVVVDGHRAERAAWTYHAPYEGFDAIRHAVAFYCEPMDACLVDGERAEPQPGGFYGGWITADITGPFKGSPDSVGW